MPTRTNGMGAPIGMGFDLPAMPWAPESVVGAEEGSPVAIEDMTLEQLLKASEVIGHLQGCKVPLVALTDHGYRAATFTACFIIGALAQELYPEKIARISRAMDVHAAEVNGGTYEEEREDTERIVGKLITLIERLTVPSH